MKWRIVFVVSLFFLIGSCAHQEIANVANQGKYETQHIKDWGKETVETVSEAMKEMDTLDEEIGELAQLEDADAIREKSRTIEEQINRIGQGLYSIDYTVPVERADRAEQCFDAILDFTGKQPEHADDDTLALHIFRLGEAKLRLEKFKVAIAKMTAMVAPIIPGVGWLDDIIKLVLGGTTLYSGVRGLQHKFTSKKKTKQQGWMVKVMNKLKEKHPEAYEDMKKEFDSTIPDKEKVAYDAMVTYHKVNGVA